MPYLNLALDFSEDPKFERLEDALGHGAGILPIRLWAYAGRHSPEHGTLTHLSDDRIEQKAGWWGARGECIRALLDIGFIDREGNGYKIHSWEKHQGHIFRLQQRNQSNSRKRWKKIGQRTYTTGTPLVHTTGTDLAHTNGNPVVRASTGKARQGTARSGEGGKGNKKTSLSEKTADCEFLAAASPQ